VSAQDDGGNDEVEEDDQPLKKSRRTTRAAPKNCGASEQGISSSTAKINSHFKVGKSAIYVFEDEKQKEPATPRHRDALSKKVPITPRHRLIQVGGKNTPRTPKIPYSPGNASTIVYNQARQLFSRCSNPGKLVGREVERTQLEAFVTSSLQSKSGGCLYVSGPPGTGKSALVHEILPAFTEVSTSVINCMSIKTTKDLSSKLSEDLHLDDDCGFDYLKSCFVRGKKKDATKYLVILDEVDRLVDLDLELLYSLFEWSMHPSSRLVLLGIANALDLTDRFLPRLKSRNLKPELLPFMPYTAGQIVEVLTTKLKSLSPTSGVVPFLQPAALQFCAKKVAGQTGDLRKAFDICRRAIDLVAQETKEKDAKAALGDSPSKMPLMENINLSSPPTPRSPTKIQPTQVYTIDTAPKATIAHIAKVTSLVFGNGTTQRLATLNLQQKAVLCALSALEKRKQDAQTNNTMFATPSKYSSSAPSIKQLYDAYSSLCKRESLLHALTNTEFRDVVSGLEAAGLVSPANGKAGIFTIPITPSKTPGRRGKAGFGIAAVGDERRVASAVGRNELLVVLDGSGGEMLRDILEGDAALL
jgi:cell division control protein 6